MNKKLFKSLILLITYAVLLVLFVVRADDLLGAIKNILAIFEPLYIGFAIAFVLNRPCRFFRRLYQKKFPPKTQKLAQPLAVATAYILFLLIIAGAIAFILPQVVESLTVFLSNISGYVEQLQVLLDSVVRRLDLELLESVDILGTLSGALQEVMSSVLNLLTSTLPHLLSLTSTVVSITVTALLSFVFSIYMLWSGDVLLGQCRRLIKAYLPERISNAVFEVGRLTSNTFTRFITGQILEACILGVLCCIGMVILRLSYAPLIGVIVAVSALIPVLGSYFGAVVSALLLLMVSPVQAITFLIFLIILQQLEGNLIYPRVVGNSVGLPGIWVLAAVTVGGGLFGVVGMLIGVPTASVLYTLLRKDMRRRLAEKETPKE